MDDLLYRYFIDELPLPSEAALSAWEMFVNHVYSMARPALALLCVGPPVSLCYRHFLCVQMSFPKNRRMGKESPKQTFLFQFWAPFDENVPRCEICYKTTDFANFTSTHNTDSRHMPCNKATFDSNPKCS